MLVKEELDTQLNEKEIDSNINEKEIANNVNEKEIASNVNEKGETIALDFDGVIHSYTSGWTGKVPKDPPMPGIEKALKQLIEDGWILKILSTRPKKYINDWLKKHNLDQYISGVYNTKIPAQIYLDDRGVHFSNWKDALADIKSFKKG